MLSDQFFYPTRILESEHVQNEEALLRQKALQIGLGERDLAVVTGKAHILLDFGREMSGGIRILTFQAQSGQVRIRFGESASEACAELGGIQNATNDHSTRDMCVTLSNWSDMTFGQTGFRFVRIDTLKEDAHLQIKSIVVSSNADTREEIGTFVCDDQRINEIWSTAAYTLRLCLQNGYFWDGVKRDRLVWIGDLYPEMRAAHCLFGDVAETMHSLDFAMQETPLPGWMADMPAYSLWWLIILQDEFRVNGQKEVFAHYIPYVKSLVRQISDYVPQSGITAYPGNFIDWPTNWTKGEPTEKWEEVRAGMGHLTCIAMQKTAAFLSAVGEDTSLCEDILSRLAKRPYLSCHYKQIVSLGTWAGVHAEEDRNALLKDGACGLSTFMSYPILSALAHYGEHDSALAIMKQYYSGMLSVGATTFWEDFDLVWLKNASRIDELPKEGQVDIHGDHGAFCYKGFRHSLCHGWSTGIIPYLIEEVAGIKSEEAGMRRLSITPHLSGLQHVKVTLPTPFGVVSVEHTQKDGKVATTVTAPKEIAYTVSE